MRAVSGCPLYGDGQGFVPDIINDQGDIFIVGQAPGGEEEAEGKPFVGKTGELLERSFLPLAGLSREKVSLGYAIRCRHKNSKELLPLDSTVARDAISHCHSAHFRLPTAVKIIVAQGDYALYALTQEGTAKHNKISDWRGFVLPFESVTQPRTFTSSIYHPNDGSIVVLATYGLAYRFSDYTATLVTKLDWQKIPRILKHKWPLQLPTIQDGPPQVWPTICAFDTEYVVGPKTNKFLCYSLAYPTAKGDGSLVLRVHDKLEPGALTDTSHVIMQNALADLPFLEKMLSSFTYDDIMHEHAVLWSDLPHDLGFMGSLYSSLNRWKHLSTVNPLTYSAADAYVTWEINEALKREFEQDEQSYRIYRDIQLKLVPIIRAAQAKGIKINPLTARAAYTKRQTVRDESILRAQATVGWPINLRSNDQVRKQLYEVEGLLKLVC